MSGPCCDAKLKRFVTCCALPGCPKTAPLSTGLPNKHCWRGKEMLFASFHAFTPDATLMVPVSTSIRHVQAKHPLMLSHFASITAATVGSLLNAGQMMIPGTKPVV